MWDLQKYIFWFNSADNWEEAGSEGGLNQGKNVTWKKEHTETTERESQRRAIGGSGTE